MGGHNALSFALGGIQGSLDAPWTASEKKRHRPLQSGFRQAERKAHLRRSEPPSPPPLAPPNTIHYAVIRRHGATNFLWDIPLLQRRDCKTRVRGLDRSHLQRIYIAFGSWKSQQYSNGCIILFFATGGSIVFDLHCTILWIDGASSSAEPVPYEKVKTFFFLPLGINRVGRQRWTRMGHLQARTTAEDGVLWATADRTGAGNLKRGGDLGPSCPNAQMFKKEP